jgi:hypothetical protein
VGFKPKQTPVNCFLGKVPAKGKDIDVSGWFKESLLVGSSSPPRFQSFTDCVEALRSQNPVPLDASTSLNTDLVLFLEVPKCNSRSMPRVPSSGSDEAQSLVAMAFQSADPAPFMPRGF